ncbi:hypothetical protein AADZ90_005935 [Aestuariibius sp. 2305UL40-4]|uniref:hypothetical protein n=1 Tax=Aestuariibius violaceus TaxID=3234132 RepID=UPI00345EA7D9
MTLDRQTFLSCAAEAGLAPSIHNTQPAHWTLRPDGTVTLHCRKDAALPVADPSGHDLLLSCGTALEGFLIALSRHGRTASVTALDGTIGADIATLFITETDAGPDPLADHVKARTTYRGGFAPAEDRKQAITNWAANQNDVAIVTEKTRLREIAKYGDALAHSILRNDGFREELLDWSRLSPAHPRWARDGLNAAALSLPAWQARLMPLFFGRALFTLFDRIGMARPLTAEADKTLSATALVFLAVPAGTSALDAGRPYYRRLLDLAALGFATWPLSVLVDDPEAQEGFLKEFGFEDHRLIAALRVGPPDGIPAERARRPLGEIASVDG